MQIRGELIDFSTPKVMAIVNLTPDSFYDGGSYQNDREFVARIEQCVDEGADILDLGAYSSRPGAQHITEKEELDRLIPKLELLRGISKDIPVSVDTFRSAVAEKALVHGADIINDISGGQQDDRMFELVGAAKTPYILMHMRGTPQNMTSLTDYENVTREVFRFFHERLQLLSSAGANDVILDPGFGFAKRTDDSFKLLNDLKVFGTLGRPMLVGISRKSMIHKTLNISPKESLTGTVTLNSIALQNGASILRVHDVKPARESVALYVKTKSSAKA